MGYTLRADPKRPYTERERRMFSLLPQDGAAVSSAEIVEAFWAGQDNVPFHPRISAMETLRSLKEKMQYNEEKFLIRMSEFTGPKPVNVWIEARERGKRKA